jgi:hypothetical protein
MNSNPPSAPKARYRELTQRLLEAEAWGTLSEAEEDALRNDMDSIWWAMTEVERDEADAWLASQRAKAPEDLGLVDQESGPIHRRPRAA